MSHPATTTSLGFCSRRSSKATRVIERVDSGRSIIPDNRTSSARTLQCMAIEKSDAVAVHMQVCTLDHRLGVAIKLCTCS